MKNKLVALVATAILISASHTTPAFACFLKDDCSTAIKQKTLNTTRDGKYSVGDQFYSINPMDDKDTALIHVEIDEIIADGRIFITEAHDTNRRHLVENRSQLIKADLISNFKKIANLMHSGDYVVGSIVKDKTDKLFALGEEYHAFAPNEYRVHPVQLLHVTGDMALTLDVRDKQTIRIIETQNLLTDGERNKVIHFIPTNGGKIFARERTYYFDMGHGEPSKPVKVLGSKGNQVKVVVVDQPDVHHYVDAGEVHTQDQMRSIQNQRIGKKATSDFLSTMAIFFF